jgi:hypothetical protein
MNLTYLFALILFALNFGNAQQTDTTLSKIEKENGIVFFSFDNGNNWKNASSGIPEKVSIGLDGVATSDRFLGVATKEYGIFIYDFKDSIWVNTTTEPQMIDGNIGAFTFFKNAMYVGTQYKGIFYSKDNGKTWITQNNGLSNLIIRRFLEVENKLYVCTNDGFYSLNEKSNTWELAYGNNAIQVNGASIFKGNFYLATSTGVYTKNEGNNWKNVLPNHSVHNISSDNGRVYAMTYNELLLSSNDGILWQNAQDGLPKDLYTFNILNQNNVAVAGQWDGVYSKTDFDFKWKKSSKGLPSNFAVTNLKSFNGILVITTSERKLK